MTAPRQDTAHAGGCTKRTYASRAQALLALDRIQSISARTSILEHSSKQARKIRRSRREHPTGPKRAYLCAHCGAYHLTSQE